MRLLPFPGLICLFCLGTAHAGAHPMGNFSINHYARFEARSGELHLRYILDFAEIPTAQHRGPVDAAAMCTAVAGHEVLAVDGHITEGALRFTVGPPR